MKSVDISGPRVQGVGGMETGEIGKGRKEERRRRKLLVRREKGGKGERTRPPCTLPFFLYILLYPLARIMSGCTLYTPVLQDKSLQVII